VERQINPATSKLGSPKQPLRQKIEESIMLSKISKIIVPAIMFAVVAMTITASSPEAFARGGHGGRGGHGHHGGHGMRREGHRFGHYRNRGYFGYRNYGWGGYYGYGYPDYSVGCAAAPVCDATAVAFVDGYPVCGGNCNDGFGWGRGYRGHSWGYRGRGRGGRGGHGGHGGHGRR
jgi:hypothetical protein